ncbi:MAG: TRAP transporter small permease [Proteobacteria bacterium]|nr:TRAP transporter small permease [Pseudomonadota bacterium]
MYAGIATLLGRLDKAGRAMETTMLVGLLSAMMLLAVSQIVLREVFNSSGIVWADELIKIIVLWLALVGSVAACRDNRHIRIDALSHILPDKAIRMVRIGVDLFAAAVCGVIAVQAWRYLQIDIEYEVTVMVDTPAWIAHSIMPVAFALISYRFLISTLQQLVDFISGASQETLK